MRISRVLRHDFIGTRTAFRTAHATKDSLFPREPFYPKNSAPKCNNHFREFTKMIA